MDRRFNTEDAEGMPFDLSAHRPASFAQAREHANNTRPPVRVFESLCRAVSPRPGCS